MMQLGAVRAGRIAELFESGCVIVPTGATKPWGTWLIVGNVEGKDLGWILPWSTNGAYSDFGLGLSVHSGRGVC